MADAYSNFYDRVVMHERHNPSIAATYQKLTNKDVFSDVTILAGGDKLVGHAGIISSRCEELLPLPPADEKKRKKKHDVKLKKEAPTGVILGKILEYIYTGRVDFSKVADLKEVLHLYIGASYFKLYRLNYLCEKWLLEKFTVQTVVELLKESTDLKENRMKGLCMQFALQHYNEFISNKDGIRILGIDLFQEVVAGFQSSVPPPEPYTPDNTPPDTLIDDLKRMHDTMAYHDIVFTVEGEQVRAHKAILAAHSDDIVNIFERADVPLLKASSFKAMLRFLYYGDDNLDPSAACELVNFARSYRLPLLLKICEDKIRFNITIETALNVLLVAYIPDPTKTELYNELKAKAYPFILENLTEIELAPVRMMPPDISIDLLLRIQEAWRTGSYGFGSDGSSSADYGSSSSSSSSSSSAPPKTAARTPAPPPRGTGGAETLPPPTLGGSGGSGVAFPPAPPPRGSGVTLPPALTTSATSLREPEGKNKKEEEKRKKEEKKRQEKEKKEKTKTKKGAKPGADPFS
eukprot:TRINITY_DN2420_c0_g1_i1.p1 TRINITY_DN2420_c0_g1~~TRINITY_DN2420_c0_g1_i1.p1  ORF type:complete len:559 (-),score=273.93 TRINITY_DN2420_c0_g1_i1:453-2012(-)